MKNLPRSLSRHARSKNNIQNKIALKTFGSAMIYFDFERTVETKYQRVNECHKQSSDLCHYVAKSEVACEVKEAFLGFDDVSNDRRAAAIFF